MSFFQRITRSVGGLLQHPLNTGSYFYADFHRISAGWTGAKRWADISMIADFRKSDKVLDMGCAEGLISVEVAKLVEQLDGVDLAPHRITRAREVAATHGVANANFVVGSILDYPVEPRSYDVVLVLNILGKGTGGAKELARLAQGTRRQIIVRNAIQGHDGNGHMALATILRTLHEQDFDAICFYARSKGPGNIIVGNRRNTDARLRTVPPLVVVPTESMMDHPCLHGATIGTDRDFW